MTNLHATLFHGTDLIGPVPEHLHRAAATGQTLVALDSKAMAWATRNELPYTSIENWLGSNDTLRVHKLAQEYEETWFAPCREQFTVDGLCWPEFDQEVLYAYWRSTCTAHLLSQGLASRGVRQLTVFRHNPPRPMLYYEPADTVPLYIQKTFSGQVDAVILPEPEPEMQATHKQNTAQPDFFLHDNLKLLQGRTTICLNPLEVFRFKRHIAELSTTFDKNVALVVNSHLARDVEPIARETGLPVLGMGPAGKPSVDITEKSRSAFANLVAAHPEPLRGMLRHNETHFEALFRRWNWLEATRGYWQRALAAAPPSLLVVSTLKDSESQLPAHVATRMGIPSISLPHGIGLTLPNHPKTSRVLYQGEVDRQGYLRSGIAPEQLVGCHDLGVENEYPVNKKVAWRPLLKKLNILVLMNPTGYAGVLCPFISHTAQIEALHALISPPADLSARLNFCLKPHPGLPDLEIVEKVGPKAQALLLPQDLPLKHALEEADLVVGLNYVGVALLHCANAGKPLALFWLDSDFGHAGPYIFADLYAPAGEMARSEDEFWSTLRRFLNEPKYAEALRQRANEFSRYFYTGERRSLREIALSAAQIKAKTSTTEPEA